MLLRDLFDEPPHVAGPALLATAEEQTAALVRRAALERLLDEHIDVFTDWVRAEHLLLSAQAQMPEQLEFSVALYKLYAYSNRFYESLTLIEHVMTECARASGLPKDPLELRAVHATWQTAHGAARKYLYALKAKAFVLLRKGDVAGAEGVLAKLALVDPLDQVGASVVRQMAERVSEQANSLH